MDEASTRYGLPLLQAGQAQKEVLHNEALTALDLLLHPWCEDEADDPPALPQEGQSWIVGAAPTGAWAGRARALAGWTAGGWRFVAPADGLTVRMRATRVQRMFGDGAWGDGSIAATGVEIDGVRVIGARSAAIATPGGGVTVDGEARQAIAAVLAALRQHGLIAP